MNKIIKSIFGLALIFMAVSSCKDFLDVKPVATLNETGLTNLKGSEALLIGVYSMLHGTGNGVGQWESTTSNWIYGSIAGGDAHKGSDPGDQSEIEQIERYAPLLTNYYFNTKWQATYEGITRANFALKIVKNVTDGTPAGPATIADTTRIIAEARALRGIFYLEAKRMWNMVPYITAVADPNNLNNSSFSKTKNDLNIWPMIEDDFLAAYNNLPADGMAVGRVNKWAAGAFYAKVLVYQGKFALAKPVLDSIYVHGTNPASTKYGLEVVFEDNFNTEKENGPESVFAVQNSVNDGAGGFNGAYGEQLNYPYAYDSPVGCCGFFQPSSELVNSYRTDASGLPLLDGSYNNAGNEVVDDQGIESADPFTEDSGNLDPRLDWTVGRRGIPYLDWGDHRGKDWIRNQDYGGPYTPIKNVFYKSQVELYTDHTSWFGGYTSNNYKMIRFADIILMLAECAVDANDLNSARNYVNEIRNRAANPAGWVKNPDGSNAANYVISPYPAVGAPFDTQANAKKAVHFERKLELAMEGHRFFDLVRWGEAATTLNAYLAYESTKRNYLKTAIFTAGRNEYYPIPQHQIDLVGDVLKQNPGY